MHLLQTDGQSLLVNKSVNTNLYYNNIHTQIRKLYFPNEGNLRGKHTKEA